MAGLPAPRIWTAVLLAFPGACASGGWRAEPGPPDDVYRRYAAAPHEVRVGVAHTRVLDARIEGAGHERWRLHSGGQVGAVRWTDERGRVLQLNGRAGFSGEFDQLASDDSIGWDGAFGLQLDWRPAPRWTWKLALAHLSSHLGDEFIEETGIERQHITREELQVGLSHDLDARWRLYGEAGWAYHLGNYSRMDRARLQSGAEWEGPRWWWRERLGLYGAADVSGFEEDDWEPNLTLQAGFSLDRATPLGKGRLGLELYTGRVRMGELLPERETSIALGIWF